MRAAENWVDYELIDASCGERLERWGEYFLIRPDPQIIWENKNKPKLWERADARYIRDGADSGNGKTGRWEYKSTLPASWTVSYGKLTFLVKPTGFKHTGLFPEQAVNWDYVSGLIKSAARPLRILNLFAYTGGATLASASAAVESGYTCEVCHLDAVKNMTEWGKTNAKQSGLDKLPVRWLTDDAVKFLSREIKRGNKYDGIILDPPSYGRGTNGEMWKLEDSIFSLLEMCAGVLSESPLFILMNSYTTGLSPSVMKYLMRMSVPAAVEITADEIGLPVTSTGMVLPCGNTAIALF
ncbi:SAM-dependent methyltransferase [Clostridia bacterium]|nr:SAM-dependent methyltransferase [Clostridia bacterium]